MISEWAKRAPTTDSTTPDLVVALDPQWLEFWTGAVMFAGVIAVAFVAWKILLEKSN